MLLLLVKNGNSVLFGFIFPPNSAKSITYSLNFAHSVFLAKEGYKEATSETHKELQGAR